MLSHAYSPLQEVSVQVYTAKYCAAIQVLEDFFNCGDRLTFSNDCLIDTPHVNADSNITIWFGYNNKRGDLTGWSLWYFFYNPTIQQLI